MRSISHRIEVGLLQCYGTHWINITLGLGRLKLTVTLGTHWINITLGLDRLKTILWRHIGSTSHLV